MKHPTDKCNIQKKILLLFGSNVPNNNLVIFHFVFIIITIMMINIYFINQLDLNLVLVICIHTYKGI